MKNLLIIYILTGWIVHALPSNWESIGPEGSDYNTKIVIDRITPDRLYAVGSGDGMVYRSDNASDTWNNISPGTNRHSYGLNIAISDSNNNEIYIVKAFPNIIYKSINAGETWETYFSDSVHNVFYIDANNPSYLLAYQRDSLYMQTVTRSTDTGNTWEEIVNGIDTNVGSITVWVNSYEPTRMIAIQEINYGGCIIEGYNFYKTGNGGSSWESINLDSTYYVNNVIFDPIDTNTVYFRLFYSWLKSTDNCTTWIEIGDGIVDDYRAGLTFDPIDNFILYTIVGNGFYKSIDGGMSWSFFNNGPPGRFLRSLSIDPQSTSVFYVSSYPHGIYKSENWGSYWTRKSDGLTMTSVSSISSPSSDTLYAGLESTGLLRTYDRGITWDTIINNYSSTPPIFIVSKSDSRRIYTLSGGHLNISNDGGENWEYFPVVPNSLSQVFDVAADDQTIYVGTSLGDIDGLVIGGIIKSLDGGINWVDVDLGFEGVNYIQKILIDWEDNLIIYAIVAIRCAKINLVNLVR